MDDSSKLRVQEPKLRLGISACLLGEEVRYNGGHARDAYLHQTLGEFVEWVPLCPEVEIGLGTPRESLRLAGEVEQPRLLAPKSGSDHTGAMQRWAESKLEELAALDLHGYVLKTNSPRCGLFRGKVYDQNEMPSRTGRGILAAALVAAMPLLPVEEEGRLNDLRLRENFVQRVFVYYRWTKMLREDASPAGLVRFHTAHKLTLMAHSPDHYQRLGRLVAEAGSRDWIELTAEYGALLMEGLGRHSTPGKEVNVLQHLMGFLKDQLSAEDKADLLRLFEDFRQGYVPPIVPITLLQHHLKRGEVPDWVHQQVYLNPYPKELMLRNHV